MTANRNIKVVPVEIPANAPYLPPPLTQEQAFALKALADGKANEDEQGVAFRCIIHTICETDGMAYRPEVRDHAFAEGKRFVGHHILKAFRMTPEQITLLPRFAPGPQMSEDDPNT